jgi:hypothetical protein
MLAIYISLPTELILIDVVYHYQQFAPDGAKKWRFGKAQKPLMSNWR